MIGYPGRDPRRETGRELGAYVVEFALLLPVVVFLLLAIANLAQMSSVSSRLDDAAREAAREGALRNSTAEAESVARRILEEEYQIPAARIRVLSAEIVRDMMEVDIEYDNTESVFGGGLIGTLPGLEGTVERMGTIRGRGRMIVQRPEGR